MDTKWKKCRPFVSFLFFFAGCSLLLGSVFSLSFRLRNSGWAPDSLSGLGSRDYQNTAEFRGLISDYLECFLGMALNGPVGLPGAYDGSISFHSFSSEQKTEADAVEEAVAEGSSGTGFPETGGSGYDGGRRRPYPSVTYSWPSFFSDDPAENQRAAKQLHERLSPDKNLLYEIACEGELLYTNAEGTGLNGPSRTLPEGYNFLLYFDGTSVSIYKDGEEMDVYKDGWYRGPDDWYVPGYKNFTTDESVRQAAVTIAAARSPMLYLHGNYSDSADSSYGNQLYWLEQDFLAHQNALRRDLLLTAAAAVLLTGAFLLRREKRLADRQIAAVTGKLWMEPKLLLLVLSGGWFAFRWNLVSRCYLGPSFRAHLEYAVLESLLPLLVFLWCVYFFANDLRWNRQAWRRSLFSRIRELFDASLLRLPVQKRLLRRCIPLWIGCCALLLPAVPSALTLLSWDLIPAAALALPVSAAVLFILLWNFTRGQRALGEDLGRLAGQIALVRGGNLTDPLPVPEDSDLAEAFRDLNDIQHGLELALAERTRSEQMKVALVSNVSHDLKTPLTSIISYIDLLKQETELPDYIADYVRILDAKAQRLREMVQDVFEVSRAASGQLPVHMEVLDLGKLLRQTLADMEAAIADSPFLLKTSLPEEPVLIRADGQRLYRVFQNLLQNALSYSLKGSRIYLTLTVKDAAAVTAVQNTSRAELPAGVDFTERFVRGDASRSDGGSGLGLSIARSFTEACGGRFRIETSADLFTAAVEFDVLQETPASPGGF